MGVLAGALAGAFSAPIGALIMLGFVATSDISGLGLLFSAGGLLGAIPIVILAGALLGALLGWLVARVFNQ